MSTPDSGQKNNTNSKHASKNVSKHVPKRAIRFLAIAVGTILVFIASTLIFTPLFMVQPNFNEEAYDKVSTLENVHRITINPKDVYSSTVYSSGTNAPDSESLPESLTGRLLEYSSNTNVPDSESLPGSLTGWLLENSSTANADESDGSDKLIVYFGGIDEDSSTAILRFADQIENGYFSSCDIACIDWPGYGQNAGNATDDSLRACARTVIKYFSEEPAHSAGGSYAPANIGYDKITILGYSMGTGPAVYAAAAEGCGQLILVAPYASSTDLYNNVTPVFYGPMKYLLTYNMETSAYAASYIGEVTIIACEDDVRVPYESSVKLAGSFPDGADFITLSGIVHGDMMDSAEILEIITSLTTGNREN